ncbi:hypothetical protein BRYFOR_09713 [Marvinbryantia formatexigens DSM 14469]|uniref:Uncharacterized protein n=1 Tax=Marvinbryantia formatexigens DSM 14469 TaxID=478749 RepID=C6LM14_9FIRM|nr:hypothetical protein BRYFOR_09713 [Marvinbryantia formatexigens DSM 14469]
MFLFCFQNINCQIYSLFLYFIKVTVFFFIRMEAFVCLPFV